MDPEEDWLVKGNISDSKWLSICVARLSGKSDVATRSTMRMEIFFFDGAPRAQ